MYISNPYFRTAYRFVTSVFLLWGVLLHFSCTDGDKTAHNLSYFTVQSNLLCLVCFLLLLRRDIQAARSMPGHIIPERNTSCPGRENAASGGNSSSSDPGGIASGGNSSSSDPGGISSGRDTSRAVPPVLLELKFAATLCIIVTFLGNHAVILFSRTYTGGVLGLPMKSFLAHYAAPLLVTLDWLLFTPKGKLRADSPLKWMLAPALYLLVTALRALCCSEDTLARTGKYPYFFLNVDLVGTRIYIYIGIYFACFLVVGYLIFLTDRILSKLSRPLFGHRKK